MGGGRPCSETAARPPQLHRTTHQREFSQLATATQPRGCRPSYCRILFPPSSGRIHAHSPTQRSEEADRPAAQAGHYLLEEQKSSPSLQHSGGAAPGGWRHHQLGQPEKWEEKHAIVSLPFQRYQLHPYSFTRTPRALDPRSTR